MMDALSRIFRSLRPHSRMRSWTSAYADGELAAAARARFEAHLPHCEQCSRAVEAARETKTLLTTLPMEDPPRTLRLTPQMASASASAPRSRTVAPLRLAQGTAALAAVGLLVLVTVGAFQGSASNSTTAADASSNESKAAVPQAASAGGAAVDAAQATARQANEAPLSGASAAGNATAAPAAGAPAPPRTGVESFASAATPPANASEAPLSDSLYAASPEAARDAGGPLAQSPSRDGASTDDGLGGRRWVEIALLGIIAVAGTIWFGLSRKTKGEDS